MQKKLLCNFFACLHFRQKWRDMRKSHMAFFAKKLKTPFLQGHHDFGPFLGHFWHLKRWALAALEIRDLRADRANILAPKNPSRLAPALWVIFGPFSLFAKLNHSKAQIWDYASDLDLTMVQFREKRKCPKNGPKPSPRSLWKVTIFRASEK